MKQKIVIIFISLLLCTQIICGQESQDALIKRKILLLPFLNKNKKAEYDYLSGIIMETLRSELMGSDIFEFTNYALSDDMFKEYKSEDLADLKTAKNIAKLLKADVAVLGQYMILENKIMILIHAVDIFTGELVLLTKEEGGTGLDLFNVINRASKDMRDKMTAKFPMLSKKDLNDLKIKEKKIFLTPLKKTGISLTVSGSSCLLIGLPVLIYDLAGYSRILSDNRLRYLETGDSDAYDVYDRSYSAFVGMLASSISISGIGLILTVIGLPLIFVKIKKDSKKISLFFDLKNSCRGASYQMAAGLIIRFK